MIVDIGKKVSLSLFLSFPLSFTPSDDFLSIRWLCYSLLCVCVVAVKTEIRQFAQKEKKKKQRLKE